MGSIPNPWGHIKFRQADNNWLGELATTTAGRCVLTRLLCKPQLNSLSPRYRATADYFPPWFCPSYCLTFQPLHPSSPFSRSPSVLFSWLRRHINEKQNTNGDGKPSLTRLTFHRFLICVNWEGKNPEKRVYWLTCSTHDVSASVFAACSLHNCAEANKRQRWWTNAALGRMCTDNVTAGAYVFECDFHPRLYAGARVGIFM